ncbi:major facilitator superfamily domain-containing protein [Syncephalastrum racemosum]|uniref:Major facilitator superfamily domain-containing protein n=1 Tax=Syncephalastrum racemosum TaxID=13706 RepID=A0A1X2HCJ1_SYNRA|nr:major facilitator superfamily domain-containing protein [Syncephalastrum racemosum]
MSSTGDESRGPYTTKRSAWARARRSAIGTACVVALTLFTDMLTYGAVLPVLPNLVMKRLKGDSSMVGFLFGSYAIGLFVATPVFAILSDRFQNRRLPMMAGTIGLVISTLSFATAESYVFLLFARIAQGVAGGASWTIGLGMLADVFPNKRLGVVMGTVLTAHTVGFAIGPAMGGFLYEYKGYAAPFICCAGFAALNFLAVLWVAEPNHAQKDKTEGDDSTVVEHSTQPTAAATTAAEVDEATPLLTPQKKQPPSEPITMWSLCKNWRILCCILCTIICSSVFSGMEPALPIYLEKTYGASASLVGTIFVAMVVPAFLAPVIGGPISDLMGRQALSASGIIMMAIAAPLVAIHYKSIYMIIPALAMFGLSCPVILTPILPEMGEVVDDLGGSAYAQVYALYNMAYSAGMAFGPIGSGLIISAATFETLMLVFSIILLAFTPVMMDWVAVWRKLMNVIRG